MNMAAIVLWLAVQERTTGMGDQAWTASDANANSSEAIGGALTGEPQVILTEKTDAEPDA